MLDTANYIQARTTTAGQHQIKISMTTFNTRTPETPMFFKIKGDNHLRYKVYRLKQYSPYVRHLEGIHPHNIVPEIKHPAEIEELALSFEVVRELYKDCKVIGVCEAHNKSGGEFIPALELELKQDTTLTVAHPLDDSYVHGPNKTELEAYRIVQALMRQGYTDFNLAVQCKPHMHMTGADGMAYPDYHITELLTLKQPELRRLKLEANELDIHSPEFTSTLALIKILSTNLRPKS